MATLNLTLNKKKINGSISSLEVNALIYGNKDQYILIDTRNKINLVSLKDGESQIVFPIGWHAKVVHVSEFDSVLFDNGEINWDHPYLKDYREWGKDQHWEISFDVAGYGVNGNGCAMHGFELKSYQMCATKSNFRPGNGGW